MSARLRPFCLGALFLVATLVFSGGVSAGKADPCPPTPTPASIEARVEA